MFFRSVGAMFRGVSAFPEFAKRNPFRALFHLLLFCLLTSFLCSGISSYFVNRKVDTCTAGLQEQFGRIVISETGIYPEKNAGEPARIYFPGNTRLDYFTPDTQFSGEEMKDWKQPMGIIWGRRGFFAWMRPDPGKETYYTMPFGTTEVLPFMPEGSNFFSPIGPDGVAAELARYQKEHKVSGQATTYLDFAGIGKVIKIYMYFVLSITGWLGNFFLVLVLILMCAGLQALWKARGLETLKFGGTFSLLCYAAFPALALKMLLDSFSFPGIGELLFFVVFFIYQMIAFNELRRSIENGSSVERN